MTADGQWMDTVSVTATLSTSYSYIIHQFMRARRPRDLLGHGVCSAIRHADVRCDLITWSLDDAQHLELGFSGQPVAALTFQQRRTYNVVLTAYTWKRCCLSRAVAHCDCWFCAPCINTLTYLLTYRQRSPTPARFGLGQNSAIFPVFLTECTLAKIV